MPGGSTKKICPFCQGILFCAQKICLNCKKEQPLKQRLKKKLQRFDEKREEWVVGHKKNHNIASIKDEAIVMLEKLHAIGYKPVLLLGKETKKKENKCEILTPRCTLSTYAQDYLQKIGSFYEYLCEGWNQDSSGNDDHLITLHLTPCDSLENTSSREEVRTIQVEETRNMLVEQATIMEGQAEQMSVTEGQTEQVTIMEGQVEQVSITEGQTEQATIMEGQAEQISTTVGQVEQMSITEGQAERATIMEGQAEQMSTMEGQGSAMGTVDLTNKNKKSVGSFWVSYHSVPFHSDSDG
ncbi:uncharacterized protein LOC131530943 isoform X2 [Onychostoma macrolepis]|uniref:uncharacterized protein LOC131530943 isoform X2 n=1 Tax=Onychostoma macrolepis TaxID=369639 RepID=UPI002729AA15|nr:uncharacterized protein LOC131530943 isoform X2 [Onychostoma macrolepis]XP_058617482.1 uncharacterized protein LOC131530943 isoform X2 [Onychostoma macrolepis]